MRFLNSQFFSIATVFVSYLLVSGCVSSEPKSLAAASGSSVPTSVTGVELKRVNKSLVRVIQHNMEINPKLEIERLNTPSLDVVDYLALTSLTVNGETFAFSDSQGVFIESLSITKTAVEVTLDFYFPQGGSAMIHCAVDIQADKFKALPCQR